MVWFSAACLSVYEFVMLLLSKALI